MYVHRAIVAAIRTAIRAAPNVSHAAQVSAVNRQVLTAVRAQSGRASKAHEGLAKAHIDITALDVSIVDMERCAEETEASVDAICKDIRAMDHAKRHLTTSISTLENFGTLTQAVSHLEATGLERCAAPSLLAPECTQWGCIWHAHAGREPPRGNGP